MTNEEVKKAFFEDAEIVYKAYDGYEIRGEIKHILYGKDAHNNLIISVEIVPKSGNSITYAPISRIERV